MPIAAAAATTPPTMAPVGLGEEESEPAAVRRPNFVRSGEGEGDEEGVAVGHELIVLKVGGTRACPLYELSRAWTLQEPSIASDHG